MPGTFRKFIPTKYLPQHKHSMRGRPREFPKCYSMLHVDGAEKHLCKRGISDRRDQGSQWGCQLNSITLFTMLRQKETESFKASEGIVISYIPQKHPKIFPSPMATTARAHEQSGGTGSRSEKVAFHAFKNTRKIDKENVARVWILFLACRVPPNGAAMSSCDEHVVIVGS